MSAETAPSWPALSVSERRVLGVLVEKQKTTDTYPLTLNSLVVGCNQKSNRDPILTLSDLAVEEALAGAQKKGLVMQVISGRVDKWRHLLYEVWKVSSVELAILAELLLRGPQTEGELRGRASRMDAIADLDTLRQLLKGLKERRLVVYLTPEERRGTLVTHGFHDPQELERLRAHHAHVAVVDDADPGLDRFAVAAVGATGTSADVVALKSQVEQLQANLEALRAQLEQVMAAVGQIQKDLGLPAPTGPGEV